MPSPYDGLSIDKWLAKTKRLVAAHPLDREEIVDAVLNAWQGIFDSRIGRHGARIGLDIHPSPQILGALLYELIPFEIAALHPKTWRRDSSPDEKDLVYIPNGKYSIEIKTSSDKSKVFGNRSYAQEQLSAGRKGKSGYYLTVNFEKSQAGMATQARLRLIRFGWLDHSDWKGQAAATGQQASLSKDAYACKLLVLYDVAKQASQGKSAP